MGTGRFVVFDIKAVFYQQFVIAAVCRKQGVAFPAGHVDFRLFFSGRGKLLHHDFRILIAFRRDGEVSEDGILIRHLTGTGFKKMNGRRQGDDVAESIGVFHTVAQRTKAAHGKTADKGVFSFIGEWEYSAGDLHQLFADEFPIVVIGGDAVDIEGVISGRHHDRQILFFCPALDAGVGDPAGIVSQKTVHEVQGLESVILRQEITGFVESHLI